VDEQGDVYVEGSQRQVKRLLRQYLVVKPACMLDQSLTLEVKVMYATQDQYSEAHSRSSSFDVTQAVNPNTYTDVQLQLKYRFLHVTDTGDLVPIYNSAQSVTASAAEVAVTF
jgi:hypothetical protein